MVSIIFGLSYGFLPGLFMGLMIFAYEQRQKDEMNSEKV